MFKEFGNDPYKHISIGINVHELPTLLIIVTIHAMPSLAACRCADSIHSWSSDDCWFDPSIIGNLLHHSTRCPHSLI